MPTRRLTDEQEREIIALYLAHTPLKDIREAYDLKHDSLVYAALHRHGVMVHKKGRSVLAQPIVEQTVLPVAPATALAVTTDRSGIVEHVERIKPVGKLSTFEVSFTSTMHFEVHDLIDAIAEARKLPMCKRVYAVKLVGNDGL